jgi:hypothetical protein
MENDASNVEKMVAKLELDKIVFMTMGLVFEISSYLIFLILILVKVNIKSVRSKAV